ncbi:MAG: glycosyltransferase [Arcobacteraceae bacterium]
MNSITIAITRKTNLSIQLEKKFDIKYYKKPSFFKKIFSLKQSYPDIYFHRGFLSREAAALIEKSQVVIVNSSSVKSEIIQKLSHIEDDKISVLSPYFYSKVVYDASIKKAFRKKYEIDKKSKIILFRAKDLEKNGVDTIFDMVSRMYKENFTLVIESSSKQINPLKLKMERSEIKFKYILLEEYENIDELFIASDIFILPTKQKYFAVDVLRAMYYRNAVFLTEENYAAELIDTFSLIHGIEDRSVSFKVDSLLINKNELRNIQKENQKIAQMQSLENKVAEMTRIIEKNFDI